MLEQRCAECGALTDDMGESCASRFNALLALDHSRREPWGSRHGQAFAAFALQHPHAYPRSLDAAWTALYRIYALGESPAHVFAALRAGSRELIESAAVPKRPARSVARPAVTIADLGDFEAHAYPAQLDAWCRATLAAWGFHGTTV
ncbi:MAG: DUF5946 family protein [Gemmatimonadaceae bacterium]